jgi:hypothetical protein
MKTNNQSIETECRLKDFCMLFEPVSFCDNSHINLIFTNNLYTYNKDEKRMDNITPWEAGVEWLTGTGARDRMFYEGDYFTELLLQHNHIDDTRKLLIDNFRNRNFDSGNNDYRLNGLQGVGKYIKDYSTLATGELTGNLAVTYLGSYGLDYKVLSINKNSALVQFTVTNSSTMASACRPPIIGYWPVWQKYIGPLINKQFSSGPMSKTTQTFIWTEYIYW